MKSAAAHLKVRAEANMIARIKSAFGTAIGWAVFLVVAVVVVLVALAILFFILGTQWAVIIAFALFWFIGAIAFANDPPPWKISRFAIALLIAWAADAFLFRIALVNAPSFYRSIVPGIVVVSIFIAFVVWYIMDAAATLKVTELSETSHIKTASESTKEVGLQPFSWGGGFLLAMFLMFNLVAPIARHYAPHWWSTVTNVFSDDEPDYGP